MALIRIEIGQKAAQLDFGNTAAAAAANEYLDAIEGDPENSDEERLEALLWSLVAHMKKEARRHKRRAAGRAAADSAAEWA